MGAVDILRLKPAFTDEQAEALARLIDENIATKRDIADVHRAIEELRKELTGVIDGRAKDLRVEIEKVRSDVAKWVVGMNLATIGVLFTLIKLFG